MNLLFKAIISACIITIITEVANKNPLYGGLIAALPLVSLISIVLLYVQGEQQLVIGKFIVSVLAGFPATVILLIIVYFALQQSIHIVLAIGLGIGGWYLFFLIQNTVVKYVKVIF